MNYEQKAREIAADWNKRGSEAFILEISTHLQQAHEAGRKEGEARLADVQRQRELNRDRATELQESLDAAIQIPPAPTPTAEPTYACEDCGKPRTKAEGGTTFTVCDECWDKHYKKPTPTPEQPSVVQLQARVKVLEEACQLFMRYAHETGMKEGETHFDDVKAEIQTALAGKGGK